MNRFVAHADFASLADLEREMNVIQGDDGFGELNRRQADHIVHGSSVSEILVTMDDVA